MKELTKILLNLRSLRVLARELTLEQLDEALTKLSNVVEERRTEEAKTRKQLAEKEAHLAAITKQIIEQGLNVDDLITALSSNVKSSMNQSKRQPRPAKYKYIDATGAEKTWTGQGRTPAAIQTALSNGKSIEDFSI